MNLSNNLIARLNSKDTFKGPLSLQNLDLSKNILTSLQLKTFSGLRALIELHLTSNKLSNIENGAFGGLNRLRVLHLENNLLTSLNSSWLQELSSLRFLYLSNNRLRELGDGTFKPLIALSVLSLHDNRIHSIDEMAFEGSIGRSLDTLDLSYNLLHDVPSTAFYQLTKLASLDLSGNPIKALKKSSFSQMHVIECLKLNNMYQLTTIEGQTFFNNGKLSQVYLDHNIELMPLPYGIFNETPVLKTLSIRNNTKWKTLSPHQIPVQSIQQLFISGISFNCNCSLTWLWKMYQRQDDKRIDMDEARCKEYTERSVVVNEKSSKYVNIEKEDRNLLSKMHPDQLTCTDMTPQTMVVIIAVSVLITVCIFLIAAVFVMLKYKRYKTRSGSGYGSPCLHIKDDTMVFRGTLKYDSHMNGNHIINNEGVINSDILMKIPSPPSYHSTNHNVSALSIDGGKSLQNQVQNGIPANNLIDVSNNEPVYEMPKYTELPNSSEGSDPKSSASGSSKYSSSGYVGSELWDPEYFVNIPNAQGSSTAHCYTNPALSNSRTLNGSTNMHGSPLNSNGTSSGIGSGSGSGSSTVSNQQAQQFKPVFFSPQPRHIGNGYNMVSTLNNPNTMNYDRSYYHHSLYQNGENMDAYPSTTTSRIMPFSSPQIMSKYSNGTFLGSPMRSVGNREDNFLMSSPPPPAPFDSSSNRPSNAFVMFNKPPRNNKRKNQKTRTQHKNSSSLMKNDKYISDSEANIHLPPSRVNSNKTINDGRNIAKEVDNETLRANSYL